MKYITFDAYGRPKLVNKSAFTLYPTILIPNVKFTYSKFDDRFVITKVYIDTKYVYKINDAIVKDRMNGWCGVIVDTLKKNGYKEMISYSS